jgi:hypothetical protein
MSKIMLRSKMNRLVFGTFAIVGLFIFVMPAISQGEESEGLIAHYLFDGNVADVTGNGNNGESGSVDFVADRLGVSEKAVSFDGANDYMLLDFNMANYFSLGSDITFSMWIKMNMFECSSLSEWPTFFIAISEQQAGYVTLSSSGDSEQLCDGEWHHVVLGSNGFGTLLYIDNVKQSQSPAVGLISRSYIGEEAQESFFRGSVDDLRIYSRKLLEDEIETLFGEADDEELVCYDWDGDGWGWDGEKGCQVPGNDDDEDEDDVEELECIDWDGDGWGWDGEQGCQMPGNDDDEDENEDENEDELICYDWDGDGWGWDGEKGCKMSDDNNDEEEDEEDEDDNENSDSEDGNNNPGECIDWDGDGWGWDGEKGCKMPNS